MYARRIARRYVYREGHKIESGVDSERGFTLLELLIVIVALGILAAIVIFALGGVSAQAAVSACKSDSKEVRIAVGAFETQSSGVPPASLDVLTAGSNPYLSSLPSSPDYAFSLQNGVVMVAAPSSATPVDASTADACSEAGEGTAGTTTTTAPVGTTTTTLPPSNGVSAAGAYTRSAKKGTEVLTISNLNAITALTVTIDVTPGVGETIAYSSEKFSFTKKDFSDSESTSGDDVIYSFSLDAGDTVNANAGGTTTAVFNSNVTTHVSSGDSWSITSTSNGIVQTVTGTF
jgi:prepilin-type N-terminal cleavage/methylation domain-containing protein